MADKIDWELFTSSVLMMSVICKFSREEIELFLITGNYDFHQMRMFKALSEACRAREGIAEHYRRLMDGEPG
jgi:hypothetical protein